MDLNPSSPGSEDTSIYNSALENLTSSSFNDTSYTGSNISSDFDSTLENDDDDDEDDLRNIKESTSKLIISESSDNLEVDPKSKLANKTIFKTDNPNLSIIEISDTSTKDAESSVYLIEPKENKDQQQVHKNKTSPKFHSNKQKLNVVAAAATVNEKSPKPSTSVMMTNGEGQQTTTNDLLIDIKKSPTRTIQVYNTIEEFEKNLPSTVTILTTPFGSKVYLVGTAHFSEESQDDVSYVIRNVRPDIVMVELCQSRIHILKHDEKTLLEEAKNINLAKVRNIINTNGFINGIFYILLLHMSAQLAKELGMAPGGEFRRAFEEVNKIPGCMLHLGDRPINITLQRALRALSLWQTLKLVWRLTSTDSISVEEVEECKQRDLLEKLMKEMAGEFPAFSDVFVKERDLYLCHSLQVAALPVANVANGLPRAVRVVGVIGIGHAAGIEKIWGNVDPNKIPEILEIPPVSTSTKIFKYTIKYGIIGLTAWGLFKFLRPRVRGIF